MGKWADALTAKGPGMEMKLLYPTEDQEKVGTYPEMSDEALPMVLVVDDEEECRRVIQDFFKMTKHPCKGAANAAEALALLGQGDIDLVVSDIKMDGKDGVELMQETHRDYPHIPFIIMTGYAPEYSYEAIIEAGASDFIAKPFSLGELKAKICRIQREQNTLQRLQLTLKKVKRLFENTVGALSYTLEKRDLYTAGHQQRVGQLACAIGEELGLPEERIEVLRLAALVHDIGKLSVPADILTKPGKLTDLEMGLIKQHCQVGFEILKNVEFPWPLAEMVYQHHERMNGSGYPQGLSGSKILLEARILAVADVVEAMSSHRPYRPALEWQAAMAEISQNRGILYDGQVVDACLNLFQDQRFTFA
jgi:putative two-component system response regulator